jgi:hypothetical protein
MEDGVGLAGLHGVMGPHGSWDRRGKFEFKLKQEF